MFMYFLKFEVEITLLRRNMPMYTNNNNTQFFNFEFKINKSVNTAFTLGNKNTDQD